MGVQPTTDRDLDRTGERQLRTGARILLLGGILFAAGLVLVLIGDDSWDAGGLTLFGFSAAASVLGLGLFLSGAVARRAAQRKPFA